MKNNVKNSLISLFNVWRHEPLESDIHYGVNNLLGWYTNKFGLEYIIFDENNMNYSSMLDELRKS